MPKRVFIAITALIACFASSANQFTINENFFEDDARTKRQKLKEKELKDCAFKRNLSMVYGSPQIPLEPLRVLERYLADANRNYIGKICHMHAWQFFLLAEKLKPLIERPRRKRDGTLCTKKVLK